MQSKRAKSYWSYRLMTLCCFTFPPKHRRLNIAAEHIRMAYGANNEYATVIP